MTNSTSAVSAKTESPSVQGLVVPDASDPGRLILKYINESKVLHAGQEILTSDWHRGKISSGFPADIPIGRITKVSLSELDATGSVPVTPSVDLYNLELVQVLTGC